MMSPFQNPIIGTIHSADFENPLSEAVLDSGKVTMEH